MECLRCIPSRRRGRVQLPGRPQRTKLLPDACSNWRRRMRNVNKDVAWVLLLLDKLLWLTINVSQSNRWDSKREVA